MERKMLIDYVAAATYFYGMIPMEKVGRLFEGHTGIGFSRRMVRQFAEAEADALKARYVRQHGDWFVFESIVDSDEIGTYLERTHRKRYFVPEMEELLRYGDQFYIEMTPQAKALKAFIEEEMQLDGECSENVLLDVKNAVDDPGLDLFGKLLLNVNLEDFKDRPAGDLGKFLWLAGDMFNHCRGWVHRGRTPLEAGEPLVLPDAQLRYPDDESVRMVRYVQALVRLYGVVPAAKVAEIYRSQNGGDATAKDFLSLKKCYIPAAWLINSRITVDKDRFLAPGLENSHRLEELIELSDGKPYYIPEKHDLLRYADEDYYEETPQSAAFRNYLLRNVFRQNPYYADVLTEYAHNYAMRNIPTGEAISRLLDYGRIEPKDDRQLQELAGLFIDMANHSRCWENRGHTPEEMLRRAPLNALANRGPLPSSVDDMVPGQAVSAKVGRNAPCPCGSGKKYKKCCGK